LTGLCEKYCPAKCRYERSSGIGSGTFKQEDGGANTDERHQSFVR